ncbi:bifunctional pyr operon transcriptional regulator/uracil phosphoribosyltransferase PyrR [Ferruginibacter yonginensis]|uniref:Bifunctional pyr operon transcriptional regulator/uracil phosphoribosyltransferase PyrR n=1 Tax=Ferruginibacter yonginensis TaxID=1310416 RepID=A0ABV8QNL8_9BACT
MQLLLTAPQLQLIIKRLAQELIENDEPLANTIFIGLQPRGIYISEKIVEQVQLLCPTQPIQYGVLDITFYRDDVRTAIHMPNTTNIPFNIEGKKVILIDDVLYTGRTIRAALDALQDFGRPQKVALCVLVNRRFDRELPIQPDYCGKVIDGAFEQKVKVVKETGEVVIY